MFLLVNILSVFIANDLYFGPGIRHSQHVERSVSPLILGCVCCSSTSLKVIVNSHLTAVSVNYLYPRQSINLNVKFKMSA